MATRNVCLRIDDRVWRSIQHQAVNESRSIAGVVSEGLVVYQKWLKNGQIERADEDRKLRLSQEMQELQELERQIQEEYRSRRRKS